MQELWFLRSARRLMLIDIYMKFREDILNGFQVIERTRFCDRQTDAPGKNNMSPYPKGGDINIFSCQQRRHPRNPYFDGSTVCVSIIKFWKRTKERAKTK